MGRDVVDGGQGAIFGAELHHDHLVIHGTRVTLDAVEGQALRTAASEGHGSFLRAVGCVDHRPSEKLRQRRYVGLVQHAAAADVDGRGAGVGMRAGEHDMAAGETDGVLYQRPRGVDRPRHEAYQVAGHQRRPARAVVDHERLGVERVQHARRPALQVESVSTQLDPHGGRQVGLR